MLFLSRFNYSCIEDLFFFLCFDTLFFCISLHWMFSIIKYLYEQEHITMLQYAQSVWHFFLCVFCIWGFVVIYSLDQQLRFTSMVWLHWRCRDIHFFWIHLLVYFNNNPNLNVLPQRSGLIEISFLPLYLFLVCSSSRKLPTFCI